MSLTKEELRAEYLKPLGLSKDKWENCYLNPDSPNFDADQEDGGCKGDDCCWA